MKYLLPLLLISLISCEGLFVKKSTVIIKDSDPALVLNAVHNSYKDTLFVSLSQNISFSNKEISPKINFVKNAEVSYSINNNLFMLSYINHPKYNYFLALDNLQLQASDELSTNVFHPNFESISADSEVPTEIIPFDVQFIENPNENKKLTDLDYGIDLSFQDNPDEVNYYSVGILGPESRYVQIFEKIDEPGFDTIVFFARPNIEIESDFAPAIDHPSFRKLTFSDENFDGNKMNLRFYFSSDEEFDPSTYFLSFRTISKSLFDLESSYPAYYDSQEFDFSGERVGLESNVSNNLGIFGIYSEQLIPLN